MKFFLHEHYMLKGLFLILDPWNSAERVTKTFHSLQRRTLPMMEVDLHELVERGGVSEAIEHRLSQSL